MNVIEGKTKEYSAANRCVCQKTKERGIRMNRGYRKAKSMKAIFSMMLLTVFMLCQPVFAMQMNRGESALFAYARADEGDGYSALPEQNVLLYAAYDMDVSEQTGGGAVADGTEIRSINLKWITEDSTDNNDANRLYLESTSNAKISMMFQVDVEFSGQYDYNPGDIRITIPAQVWHARKVTAVENGPSVGTTDEDSFSGSMELPIPVYPSTEANFNWQLINGEYVLTNARTIKAASSHTFKFAITDLLPMDVVDMSICDPITARVEVTTHEDNPLKLDSEPIDAQINTSAEIKYAKKSGKLYESYPQGESLSAQMLEKLPDGTKDDYIYVKWTSYHARTNNQPFGMDIEDVYTNAVDEEGNQVTEAVFLGITRYDAQPIENKDNAYSAQISSYDRTAADGPYYYNMVEVWTAYKKSDFPLADAADTGDPVYKMSNTITWKMTETDEAVDKDDRKETSQSDTSTVYYSPVTWKRPLGHFKVNKWTENTVSKDWVYGYALNRIKNNERADMTYIVRTTGYGYPWTSAQTQGKTNEELNDKDALIDTTQESFGQFGWKQVTEDSQTFFNFEDTALTADDFGFVSVQVYEPLKKRYGKNADGSFSYSDDPNLPTPDLIIEYRTEGGDWTRAATATWGTTGTGAMRFIDEAAGVRTENRTLFFPVNADGETDVCDVRYTYVSNVYGGFPHAGCQTAAILWDVKTTIGLKPSERIKGIIEDLFEENDEPSTKFENNVYMDAFGWVGSDGEEQVVDDDFDYSRATLKAAGYGVRLEKSVTSTAEDNNVEKKYVTLHYKGVVTEQSRLKDRADYLAAVASGVIPAETSGVFYDLMPENVMPVLSTVKLREKDIITNVYTVPNYKGTKRVLLVVEAKLTPDPVFKPLENMPGYADQLQITFDAQYFWNDLENNDGQVGMNYMAFESTTPNLITDAQGNATLGTIKGETGEPDDPTAGNNVFTPDMPDEIDEALKNLNPHGKPGDNRFVYGQADAAVEVVTSTESNLDKMVCDDLLGIWTQGLEGQEQVSVYEGHGYTYRLRVSSAVNSTKDIVFYDSLENFMPTGDDFQHMNERKGWSGKWYGKGQWKGTLRAVDLSELIEAGAAPVIYYSVSESGPQFPHPNTLGDQNDDHDYLDDENFDLTNNNIWIKADALDENGMWTVPEGTIVTGIAIDARKTASGADFVLLPDHSMSAYLKMAAPHDQYDPDAYNAKGAYAREADDSDAIDWEAATDPGNNMYAFNNTYMYHAQSRGDGEVWNEPQIIYNDYTRVGIMPEIITVEKEWQDRNDHDQIRPDAVTITAMRKLQGVPGEPQYVLDGSGNKVQAELSEANGWKAAFNQLDVINENGVRCVYSFEESDIDGYESKLEFVSQNKFRLINIHEIEQIEIEGVKEWDDNDNALGLRPASITLDLYCDGKYVKSQKVYPDSNGNWSYSFGEMDKYGPGRVEHVYTVVEEYVPKYSFDDSDLKVLKNTYDPYGNLEVQKIVEGQTDVNASREFTFSLALLSEVTADNQNAAPLTDSFEYRVFELKDGEWEELEEKTGTITGSGTFSIKANQKLVVYRIPSESTYQVTETDAAGFVSSAVDAEGQIEAGRTQQAVFTNSYSASGYLDLSAKKMLTGHEMHNRQFRFELVDMTPGSENEGEVISEGRNGTPAVVENAPVVSEADVHFGRITYSAADAGKTFIYQVREVAENRGGYIYDETVYTVRVEVSDNGDGTLSVVPTFYAGEDVKNEILFENEYRAAGDLVLEAAKLLYGRGLTANEFTFELFERITENGVQEDVKIGTAKNTADGKVVFEGIDLSANAKRW